MLCSRAVTLRSPFKRSATGTLYDGLSGSSWAKNQSRSCAKESETLCGCRCCRCRRSASSLFFSPTDNPLICLISVSISLVRVCQHAIKQSVNFLLGQLVHLFRKQHRGSNLGDWQFPGSRRAEL